jgi:ABC-type amino acid transport substrate-binding protein
MPLTGSAPFSGRSVRIVAGAIAVIAVASLGFAQTAPTAAVQKATPAATTVQAAPPTAPTTLNRVRESARIRFGYRADARPFAYRDDSGNAVGYAVALCQQVADAVKVELGLPQIAVEWVPVTAETSFQAVQQGQVDLLCGLDAETLARRKDVAFSIPIFPGGIGALLRADAPVRLREILSGQALPSGPTWRASAGQLLQSQIFAVVAGTTAQDWLAKRLNEFQLTAQVVPVDTYVAGIQQVLDRKANVFFGVRAILLEAARRNPSAADLLVLDRRFANEPLGLALARGDEDFRLVVDRTLSRLYASGGITDVYAKWFGPPDEQTLTFFRLMTLPE